MITLGIGTGSGRVRALRFVVPRTFAAMVSGMIVAPIVQVGVV